ncbi:MAG: hypothetical protein C0404_01780 [Verrucomicrobia bacterium]|nr:hypothetical protein [Verrucomicrobiota bacterium]
MIASAVLLAWVFGPKLFNMKAEYVTAGVIRDVGTFVKNTHGQWPKSWGELKSEDLSSYTRVNFALDPATATEQEVLSSIAPRSGRYHTYPQAAEDLKSLYRELKNTRKETVQPTSAGDAGARIATEK